VWTVSNPVVRSGSCAVELRQEHARARTLEFAEEAASRGDFADALAWLEAIDRRLPAEYVTKQQEWRLLAPAINPPAVGGQADSS
jgi:hypothetical protein